MKMQILIPIETSSRELLYKTYLSSLLAIEGFDCYIGTKRNISFLLSKFENYIYLDKGYHAGNSDVLYKKIKSKNGVIINLDEEGAIDFPDGSTLKNRYTKQLFEASDKVLLWGNYQLNLLKNLNLPIQKIKVTGHPRFELLKKEYHNLYKEEVEEISKRFGKFILINSNFGFGNNIKGVKFVVENYAPRVKRINEIVAFDKVKQEKFIGLVKELAKNHQNKIVYRPHPEEKQNKYKEAFKGLDNVFLIYEGSVVPWLIAADVMIHPDCTTGIESIMIGKKSISYLPKDYNPEIVTQLPLDISFRFDNSNDIIQFIKNKEYLANNTYGKDFNIIDYYFSYAAKSTKEIVKCFNELKPAYSIDSLTKLSFLDRLILKAKDYKLKKDISEKIRLSKNKLYGFEYDNIKALKNKLKEVNYDIHEVKIKEISNQLFKISK
jgi:surface carbohydrate biosynthesis protein